MTRQWIIDFCDRQQGRSARLAGLTSFRFGNRNALERLALAMERFWFNCKLRAIGYSRQRLNALAARLKATAEREIAANARAVRTDGPPRDSGTHEAVVGREGDA